MMDNWISSLLLIIAAQAIGVGWAWRIDAVSWEHRPAENAVAIGDFVRVIVLFAVAVYFVLFAVAVYFFSKISLTAISGWFVSPLLWLLVVSQVQKRQLNVTWRTAFFGAFIQFCWFCLSILVSCFFPIFLWFLTDGIFSLVYLVSAALTYALLSLFRPTIYEAWNTLRQNFRNN